MLLSPLLDLDFLFLERESEPPDFDLGDFDLDLRDLERSVDRDLDLRFLDLERDLRLLDFDLERRERDFERDFLDFKTGERDRWDLEVGDLDFDFFARLKGDFERDFRAVLSFSRASGVGERLDFFFPSAMLISLAWSLEIATAASLKT